MVVDAFNFIQSGRSANTQLEGAISERMRGYMAKHRELTQTFIADNQGGQINAKRNAMTSGRTREPAEREMLKLAEVIKATGLHRNTINNLVKRKKFPQPVRPNDTIRHWFKDEVDLWRKGNWKP
jgi:predicted DNA-binding transcriptional regulator AlpA